MSTDLKPKLQRRLTSLQSVGQGSSDLYHELYDALAEIERLERVEAAARHMMTIPVDQDLAAQLDAVTSAGDDLRKALGLPPAPRPWGDS